MPITGMEGLAGISGINGISGMNSLVPKVQDTPQEGFGQMLTDAIKEADNASVVSAQGTEQLLAGNVDNIAQIMIDGSKSELSLNLVIQVRNKFIDAYNEIMRMQV